VIARRTALRPGAPPKRKSWLARSTKPIPQVNVDRAARRAKQYQKMLASSAYKAAKAEAMVRAHNQCEYNAADMYGLCNLRHGCLPRCDATEGLDAHHLRYPKVRPIAATDLVILCKWHHRREEGFKPHKHGRPF
jgi:hypothetical protein